MMLLLFVSLFLMICIGVPIGVSLGASSLLYFVVSGDAPALVVAHRMVSGVDSFPLLAVPFFVLAGNLMNVTGVTERIFAFARACVGWMHGGLGHVNIGASVVFAGMSGAAVADAGGLGAMEIKAMRDADYDPEFAVGVTAASSTIGPIIPPSLPLVIYGVMSGASIGALFLAGILPGLIMAGALMAMVAWFARKRGYPKDQAFQLRHLGQSFLSAFLSLVSPAIIVGGIMFGIFTPTEAAVAACAYALALGAFVYRTLTWEKLVRVSLETIETTSVVFIIVAGAAAFSWILVSNRVTEDIAVILLAISENPIIILLMINAIIFLIGFFMETIAAITILTPVLLPIAMKLNIDPVHFGIILILNLMIGLLTPPVGMVLYVLSKVSRVPFEKCVSGTLPFLIPLSIVLMLVTFIPALSLWLPSIFGR